MTADERFMGAALEEARAAAAAGEMPVGCVIVKDGVILARARNECEARRDATAHAELLAIRRASEALGDWRLAGATLYVTLEPCPMCAGAIVQARIPECVIACMNPKAGCAGSVVNLLNMKGFNHQVDVRTGVLEEECREILQRFFRELRERDRARKAASV